IWVPETFGSVAYLSRHEELYSKLVAGINLDMVGQDQEICKSTLTLDNTPDSLPSYLNDYVFSLIEQSVREFDSQTMFGGSSTFRYRASTFSGGSDHAEFNNSTVGVPCVMLLQWPDLYYHTSMDTIDKVSADTLKRIGWITTIAALTLANATAETAFLLASQTAKKGVVRIEEAGREAIEELFRKREDPKLKDKPEELTKELTKTACHFKNKIEHIIWREQKAIKSVKRLGENPELDTFLNKYCNDIENLGRKEIAIFEETLNFIAKALSITLPAKLEETETEAELKRLIPRRLFKGTLDTETLKQALSEKEYEWYQEIWEKDPGFGKKMEEIVNFIDGKRSAYNIVMAVSAEYDETNPGHVLRFLKDMEKAKLVIFE
ncbi:MAG: M28 family peptidase, partial [Candidatus Bathyarchaeia archaeon]